MSIKEKNSVQTEPPLEDKDLRVRVMKQVTVNRPSKVDIRSVGGNRYRVNVWAENTKTENDFIKPLYIAQTFYYVD